MSSLSHGSALVKQPVTFLKNYWRNRITEQLRSAGISGGLQFNLLLRAGSATRLDHTAQDFIQSAAANLQMQRLHEPLDCHFHLRAVPTPVIYMYAHRCFSSCHTLLRAAWVCLLGVLLMVLGGPAQAPQSFPFSRANKCRSLSPYSVGHMPQTPPGWACPEFSPLDPCLSCTRV